MFGQSGNRAFFYPGLAIVNYHNLSDQKPILIKIVNIRAEIRKQSEDSGARRSTTRCGKMRSSQPRVVIK